MPRVVLIIESLGLASIQWPIIQRTLDKLVLQYFIQCPRGLQGQCTIAGTCRHVSIDTRPLPRIAVLHQRSEVVDAQSIDLLLQRLGLFAVDKHTLISIAYSE